MNLRPIGELLVAAKLGKLGKDLFFNMMPVEVEQGILLRTPLTGTRIDYELPGYYKTEFQLIVRGREYKSADGLISKIVSELTIQERQLEGIYVTYCRPRTEPVAFPLSRGNLIEFSVTFDINFTKG